MGVFYGGEPVHAPAGLTPGKSSWLARADKSRFRRRGGKLKRACQKRAFR